MLLTDVPSCLGALAEFITHSIKQAAHGIDIVKETPNMKGLKVINHPNGKVQLKHMTFPCLLCDTTTKGVSQRT